MQQAGEHFTKRSNWLRAAVLGANDGILSTTSIVIGVAAACPDRYPIVLAALAGMVAGAFSMAAGEYVSVSSQTDIETSELEREKIAIETDPQGELEELAGIYERRGLDKELANKVATQLMKHDALEAHARDELGINEIMKPHPFQAAFASAAAFVIGSLLPFIVAITAPIKDMICYQYGFAILFLAASGFGAAKLGGCSHVLKAVGRICLWGTVAMAATALTGYLFGVNTH